MRHSTSTPPAAGRGEGKEGVTIRYALADLRPSLRGLQICEEL